MKKRNLLIGFAIITIVSTILFVLWSINNYQNEKQLNEDLAVRFDESMEATYPFLLKVSDALYMRTNMLENNATVAINTPYDDYKETFRQLNSQYMDTENGHFMINWIMAFDAFYSSAVCGYLEGGGELRKKESKAFRKLLYAKENPSGALEMEYDSLIAECNKVKVALAESMRDLAKYNKPGTPLDASKDIDPSNYSYIFKRYYQRKNWPFNFRKNRH